MTEAMPEPTFSADGQSAELLRIGPAELVKAKCSQEKLDLVRMTAVDRERVSRIAAVALADHASLIISSWAVKNAATSTQKFRIPITDEDYIGQYYQKLVPDLESKDEVRRAKALRFQGPIIKVGLDAAERYPEIAAAEEAETQFYNDDLEFASQSMTALLTSYGSRLIKAQRYADQRVAEQYTGSSHANRHRIK